MQIDKRMLDRLLTMNDEQLGDLIRKIAAEAGIDPAALGMNPENIATLRTALGSADAQDLAQYNRIYDEYRKGRRQS
jgi:hypothetical protein